MSYITSKQRKDFWARKRRQHEEGEQRERRQVSDPSTHRAVVQGDEYYCPRCNKRWDVHEEPPPCAKA